MKRILIADDNAENRYLLEALLAGTGHAVDVATNGAEALELARRSPPDLIVTDILMPVMDGFELCRQWRQDERLQRIPFVVYTATYTEPEDERLALDLGADRFIVKPQKPEVLLQVIREVLDTVGRDPGAVRLGPAIADMTLVEQHNAALMRKLEKKVAELEAEIARRKAAEEGLRRTGAFLDSIIEHIPDMIVVKDAQDLRFVRFNRAGEDLIGHRREDLIGKSDHDIFPREQADHIKGWDREVLRTGRIIDIFEEPIQTRDKGKRLLHTKKVPILNSQGEPEYLLGISEDVTDRRRAEQEQRSLERQLQEAQKMESIGRLAGGIAHDFNNLLSVILSYADLVLEALPDGHPVAADVKEILAAGTRAAALTRQLLAFSRKQILEPEVLSLNRVVSGIESLLRRLLGEDIQIETRLAEDLGSVVADPGQMEQVLMNLAVNARDAMPRGGRLIIATANVELDKDDSDQRFLVRPGRYVMLSVTDTGLGMDAETLSHVFEPFFTTKERGKGTGLGLSTVYGIVKQSGGNVWVYSEPERGTTFKIYLPRINAPAVDVQPGPVASMATGNETLLIVEDEDAVRRMAERVLRDAGYRVHAMASGAETLRYCNEHGDPVDLLLTDVTMPGMSGCDLSARLAQSNPGLKVLFMSGYLDEESVLLNSIASGTRFIAKPFTAAELTRKVREVLDEARSVEMRGRL